VDYESPIRQGWPRTGYGGDTAGAVAGSLQAGVVVAIEASAGERGGGSALVISLDPACLVARLNARPLP
jgi:hypothetical protein